MGRGEALCENCNTVFDALAALEQTPAESRPVLSLRPGESVSIPSLGTRESAVPDEPNTLSVPSLTAGSRPGSRVKSSSSSRKSKSRSRPSVQLPDSVPGIRWNVLTTGLLVLLWVQYLFFEGDHLVQNPTIRPWLEQVCSSLGCAIPPYRDFRAIQTTQAALLKRVTPENAYEFRLVMSNQSRLPQAFPRLKLVLSEIDGKTIAERIFEPFEYLSDQGLERVMSTGKSYEVRLLLAPPHRSIGGYHFSMI